MGSGDTAINAMGLDIDEFRRVIYGYYTEHGRVMPWRLTRDPYCILVSELMLQQTQVERVLGKYEAFVEQFPRFCLPGRKRPSTRSFGRGRVWVTTGGPWR